MARIHSLVDGEVVSIPLPRDHTLPDDFICHFTTVVSLYRNALGTMQFEFEFPPFAKAMLDMEDVPGSPELGGEWALVDKHVAPVTIRTGPGGHIDCCIGEAQTYAVDADLLGLSTTIGNKLTIDIPSTGTFQVPTKCHVIIRDNGNVDIAIQVPLAIHSMHAAHSPGLRVHLAFDGGT